MLFSYHLLYFCTALSLIIMLSSHYHHHKSKTFSQLTQCPFTGTLLLFSSVTSTLKLKTHSQLTQSPFTGTDCLFISLFTWMFHNVLIHTCRQQNIFPCNKMVLNTLMADPMMTIFGHYYFIYICVIYSSSTRVQLASNKRASIYRNH